MDYAVEIWRVWSVLSWWLSIVALVYGVTVVTFIVLENRSPQLTFAWLLLFFGLPVLGVIIYLMFGRDHWAFSRENKLLRQELRHIVKSNDHLAQWAAEQKAEIEKLKQIGPPVYGRVLDLLRRNAAASLFPCNSLEILQNGCEKFPRLIEDMRGARHSIHLEYYEWGSDSMMEEINHLLLQKVKEGVEVRLMYDPVGSIFRLKGRDIRKMNAGGVKMVPYSPLYYIHTISYRNHRKIAVIDGCIGYTGGMNMAEMYLKGPSEGNFTGWRDTHVRFTGQAVWGLQASFIIQWFNTTRELLADSAYFPPLPETPGYLPLQIVNSGPDSQWKAIRQLYFAMITAAQHHVYIQSPFFILDESLAEALSGAARAGIDVKVMLAPNGPDGYFAYRAGFTYAANMAAAGVQIFYYQGDYFHCKTINIDSVLCSIGSANMDIRSFTINYELNLVIYDEKTAKKLAEDFIKDLTHCQEFKLKAYKQSNIFGRVRDSVFRLASPLL
ncbi:MAG: cardiolipin synthase [Anaerolineales bacterium]|nr:cardiolipin synthase [Anaerolineales bacterium]